MKTGQIATTVTILLALSVSCFAQSRRASKSAPLSSLADRYRYLGTNLYDTKQAIDWYNSHTKIGSQWVLNGKYHDGTPIVDNSVPKWKPIAFTVGRIANGVIYGSVVTNKTVPNMVPKRFYDVYGRLVGINPWQEQQGTKNVTETVETFVLYDYPNIDTVPNGASISCLAFHLGGNLYDYGKPNQALSARLSPSRPKGIDSSPAASGTGFFISEDGFLITNEHVVEDATRVRLLTSAGLISAKVVKVNAANDLALLKAEGRFAPLPIAASQAVELGATVATVGFPNVDLQGFMPKLAKGEIASLSGVDDDVRDFQISVPVQPGNSGGALVDERGNVVGVVSAKLSPAATLATSGTLPENVNYAIKSSYLLSFLESMPEVSAKLKAPEAKERKFEDVVKSARQAAVLVLVY